MPTFEPNRPITTERPAVVVDAGLQPGRYRFRLVVVDEAGNESLPSEQIITVRESGRPVPLDRVPRSVDRPQPPAAAPAEPRPPWWQRWRF